MYMGQDDIDRIVDLYKDPNTSLRDIAKIMNTNHKLISRVISSQGISIVRKIGKSPSKIHIDKITNTLKEKYKSGKIIPHNLGKKNSKIHNYKNMKEHLKYDVSLEWLMQFDIDKLKFLNRSISRERDCSGFDTNMYITFIEKFYTDEKFNRLYDKWIETNDVFIKPSLDHINPKSKGGGLGVDNLSFISWFENRCKWNIDPEKWDFIKESIFHYF